MVTSRGASMVIEALEVLASNYLAPQLHRTSRLGHSARFRAEDNKDNTRTPLDPAQLPPNSKIAPFQQCAAFFWTVRSNTDAASVESL